MLPMGKMLHDKLVRAQFISKCPQRYMDVKSGPSFLVVKIHFMHYVGSHFPSITIFMMVAWFFNSNH